MANRVSGFKKSKATKEKENYVATTGSDFTSQDIFYTTESNETRPDYEYKTKRRKYFDDYYTSDTYDTKFFDKYDHGGGEDSYTYDDYTTSAISYDETRGKPRHFKAPPSKSEESVNRYGRRRHGRGYRSRDRREYDYFSPEEYSNKRRSKLTTTPDKHIQYPLEYEDIDYIDKGRRSHSPRGSIDYESYYTVPEKEYDYKKYFELTKSRDKSPGKHKRAEKPGGHFEKKNKKQVSPQKRGKDYQVYAYQETNQHKDIFKGNNDITGGTFQLSEIEVKTHEYPVLAFKDTNSGSNGSDTVYLPVLVMDKSVENSVSANKNVRPEVLTPAQLGNIQIFAANLHNQKNIFTEYGDSSEKNKVSLNKKTPEIPSGLQNAGSILGSVFDQFDAESAKPNFLTNTTGNRRVNELSYQVIVDVAKSTDNRKSASNLNPFEYKQVEDPLHDDYPVTKDYIKVNDNTSEKLRSSMTGSNKHLEKRKSSTVKQQSKPSSFDKVSTKKGSREVRNSTTLSSKKPSIVESPVRSERASTIRQSTTHRQSKMLDGKRSSVAVASHLEPDRSIGVREPSAISRLSTINENNQEDEIHRLSQAPAFLTANSENRKSRADSKLRSKQSQQINIPIVVTRASTTSIKNGVRQRQSTATIPKTSSNSRKNSMIPTDPLHNFRSLDNALQNQTTNSQEQTVQQTLAPQDSRLTNKSPSISSRRMSVVKQSKIESKASPVTSRIEIEKRDTETLKKKTSIIPNMLETNKLTSVSKEVVAKNKSKESLRSSAVRASTNSVTPSKRDSPGNLRSSRVLEDVGIISENYQDQREKIVREPTYIAEEKITAIQDLSESETHPPPSRANSSMRGVASALVNFSRSRSSQKPSIRMKSVSRQGSLTSGGKSRSIKEDETQSMKRRPLAQSPQPTLIQYDNQLKKSETLKSSKSKTGEERKKVTRQSSKTPKVMKKKSSNIFRVFSSRSLSRGKAKSKSRDSQKSRSPNRFLGFPRLRRSKAKARDRSLATSRDRTQASAGDGAQAIKQDVTTKEPMTSPEVSDVERNEEDLCECYVQYMHQLRKCMHFFLGTTLHEQIMNILKVMRPV